MKKNELVVTPSSSSGERKGTLSGNRRVWCCNISVDPYILVMFPSKEEATIKDTLVLDCYCYYLFIYCTCLFVFS